LKVVLGLRRLTLHPESVEEYVILQCYLDNYPKITGKWDETSDIDSKDFETQSGAVKVMGLISSPYLMIDFDEDEHLEEV